VFEMKIRVKDPGYLYLVGYAIFGPLFFTLICRFGFGMEWLDSFNSGAFAAFLLLGGGFFGWILWSFSGVEIEL